MITITGTDVYGFQHAVKGARNSWNSWEKSDSCFDVTKDGHPILGENDLKLLGNLAKAGGSHAKSRRKIVVYADITAPLYWWKQMDTYKIGTVSDSTSTMHTICAKQFDDSDFSIEHLTTLIDQHVSVSGQWHTVPISYKANFNRLSFVLNKARDIYLDYKEKGNEEMAEQAWWQIIQLLPESYNQLRSMMFNYENLSHMYHDRRHHKLGEWHVFCEWVETLPYSKELIIGEV